MVRTVDLCEQSWQLAGWRPYCWKLRKSMETEFEFSSEIKPIAAAIPSSVQHNLLAAGVIGDWNVGRGSLAVEWVEHRHWEFFTTVQVEANGGEPIQLHAAGLDYSGWILVDAKEVASFRGALIPHVFDLTDYLGDGEEHTLSVVFDEVPAEQGQIGYSSRSQYFKPRYNYSWDWCPRMVPMGIWGGLRLRIGKPTARVRQVATFWDEAKDCGCITVLLDALTRGSELVCTLTGRDGETVGRHKQHVVFGLNRVSWNDIEAELWYPNGLGDQAVYRLHVTINDGPDGNEVVLFDQQVGFKWVKWLACEGAREGADPWICQVNGEKVFLQGVNWTPIRLDYHSLGREDYARYISRYKDMGVNLLRVWGGGFLERQDFYELCDEAGIFVWQEFPLSSSGVDNLPPTDAGAIDELVEIARSYIERRGHHVCKLMWCGGNELITDEADGFEPVDVNDPCIRALAEVVAQMDSGTRFVATSPSGPKVHGASENFGKGVHYDVHGPWKLWDGGMKTWKAYWEKDDALFRSETGAPGAADAAVIMKYEGDEVAVPPSNETLLWRHSSMWWNQWDDFADELKGLSGVELLERYAGLSQALQAEALAYAAKCCKDRFPRCGGFLVWMGHDAFPCPANTSIIDFDGNEKPAARALRNVFLG